VVVIVSFIIGAWKSNRKHIKKVKKINILTITMLLPELKEKFPWLKEVNSQSHQAALRDLDIAFTRFFKKLDDYPKFKSKHKSKASFHIPQHFKIKEDALILPKLGKIKAVIHREVVGKPKSITISISRSGNFFASILVEQDIENPDLKPVDPKTTIGLDVGIKTFVVSSNGKTFDNPKNINKSISKVKYLSRQHSQKQKGGKNKERARILLARQHEKVSNQRRDFLHKVSNQIADENQVSTICIEDLNIKSMLKNHKLARAICDCSWAEFFRMLEYKCKWRGIRIIQIGRFEPSSKLCPCGFKNDLLTLEDRSWTCPKCGTTHDRDLLAANNIRRFGLAKLASPAESKGGRRCRLKLGELPIRKLGVMNQEAID